MGRRVVQSRRMKLLRSVLLGTVFGQYEDYGAYGYSQYSAYEYDQYGNKKNKKNQYVAPSYNEGYNSYGKQYGEDEINLGRFNGLHCWSCDARVSADVDVGADAATNAFKACIANGANQACRGEQRVCMTETRARYDRVYAIHASCKSPDACVALWRRNARFTLPFMLFGKHTDTATTPQYMDDECRIYTTAEDQQKFESHRSQWESVCRHCCVADKGESASSCNRLLATPLAIGCTGASAAGTGAACTTPSAANSVQALAAGEYKYEKLAAFMKLSLNSLAVDGSTLVTGKYPMPVEGRNSITEGKVDRDQNSWEESDQLSRETLDHFDIRKGGK